MGLYASETFCRGDFGRLGHGNSSDLFTPQPIKALQGLRIKQIACGDSHCLAVTMEGEVQRLVFFLYFLGMCFCILPSLPGEFFGSSVALVSWTTNNPNL